MRKKSSMPRVLKLLVRLNYAFMCFCCSKQETPLERLTIHHKRPKFFGGNNDLKNLVLLCKSCHIQVHKKINSEGRRRGFNDNVFNGSLEKVKEESGERLLVEPLLLLPSKIE